VERGPYDRPDQPPAQPPGQPPAQPGYAQREPGYGSGYEPPPERRFGVPEVVAVLAMVVAIVAIFLALDARNEGSSQEEINRQVRQETQRQVDEIREATGQQAQSANKRARGAESEAEKAQEDAAELNSSVARLEKEVSSLKAQQNQMRDSLQKQSEAIADIRRTLRE
jgi:hypothetical protein